MRALFVGLLFGAMLFTQVAHAQTQKANCRVFELSGKEAKLSEGKRLHAFFDKQWTYWMMEFPTWATSVGFPGQNHRWPDLSLASFERREKELDCQVRILEKFNRKNLSEADRLNLDLALYDARRSVESNKFGGDYLLLTQMGGPHQTVVETLRFMPMSSEKDFENILARLNGAVEYLRQNQALLEEGIKKGVVPPRFAIEKVPSQIDSLIKEDPTASPLFESFKEIPTTLSNQVRERIQNEAKSAIATKVYPALRQWREFVAQTYLPKTRTTIAWKDLPNGQAWYEYNVRSYTSLNLTARELHDLGLKEVARLREAMEKIRTETGFKGDLKEFFEFLRTDQQFFFNDAESLLRYYRDIAKRADPELAKVFGKLPRLTYGVIPIPSYMDQSSPTAYYLPGSLTAGRPGYFYANTYNLKSRPKWEMEALTLHEAVPGHHLQISLAQELDNLPRFRRNGGHEAYVEGWGLYAESLGYEMGLYKDAYSRFGQVSYEMWRACRLVVDTGMHSLGWSREQAIAFMRDNLPKPQHDIEVEVDRYIVWAGQALAYKVGELTIRELRNEAKTKLAERFDIRRFHDAVLAEGSMPLEILKKRIREWIAREAKAPAGKKAG